MAARILKGPKVDVPEVTMSLGEAFFKTAEKYADRPFQIDADTETIETWSEAKQKSVRVAIWLKSIGIKPKEVIFSCCKTNFDSSVPVLAAFLIGAYSSSCDPCQDKSDIEYMISLVEPKVVFVDDDSLTMIEQIIQNISNRPFVVVLGNKNSSGKTKKLDEIIETKATYENEVKFVPYPSDINDTSFILFSSGTTDLPKGICLSHQTMMKLLVPGINPEISIVQFTTFYWISAAGMFAIQINSGCSRIVAPNIGPKKFLYLVENYKIPFGMMTSTYTYGITNLGKEIISSFDTSGLRIFAIVGSGIELGQLLKLRKLFPHTLFFNSYGMTELGGGATGFGRNNDLKIFKAKAKSSGTPLPNTEFKFVDVETREPLPPNMEGEIMVKTHLQMIGYYKSNSSDAFDEEGFLKTGDLGYYDDDNFIYVTGRLKFNFKYLQYKISPAIVESALLEHPAVQEVVVFGLPDDTVTHLVAACVVLQKNAEATAEELKEYVSNKLPDYCKLRGGIRFVKEVPKTVNGKVERRKLKDIFLNA